MSRIFAPFLSAPDSIGWLLNIRGNDVDFTPLPLSFAILHKDASVDLFVDGRKVPADECLRIGLCEYVVPNGEARAKAEELAREIAAFPRVCVRADRRSAIRSHGLTVREALILEWYNGRRALIDDGVAGATRFKNGLGRHGDFERIR